MPVRHDWELRINDETIEARDKAHVISLAKAAKATGAVFEILENGQTAVEMTRKYSGQVIDKFTSETMLSLNRISNHASQLTREFENGMSETDLREEIGELMNRLEDLYKVVDKRLSVQADAETYGWNEQQVADALTTGK